MDDELHCPVSPSGQAPPVTGPPYGHIKLYSNTGTLLKDIDINTERLVIGSGRACDIRVTSASETLFTQPPQTDRSRRKPTQKASDQARLALEEKAGPPWSTLEAFETHLTINLSNGRVIVAAEYNPHSVLVNFRPLWSPLPLKTGDIIDIGACRLLFIAPNTPSRPLHTTGFLGLNSLCVYADWLSQFITLNISSAVSLQSIREYFLNYISCGRDVTFLAQLGETQEEILLDDSNFQTLLQKCGCLKCKLVGQENAVIDCTGESDSNSCKYLQQRVEFIRNYEKTVTTADDKQYVLSVPCVPGSSVLPTSFPVMRTEHDLSHEIGSPFSTQHDTMNTRSSQSARSPSSSKSRKRKSKKASKSQPSILDYIPRTANATPGFAVPKLPTLPFGCPSSPQFGFAPNSPDSISEAPATESSNDQLSPRKSKQRKKHKVEPAIVHMIAKESTAFIANIGAKRIRKPTEHFMQPDWRKKKKKFNEFPLLPQQYTKQLPRTPPSDSGSESPNTA